MVCPALARFRNSVRLQLQGSIVSRRKDPSGKAKCLFALRVWPRRPVIRFGTVSEGYKLQTLLELRDQAVADAEQTLRAAAEQLLQAEFEQRRLSVAAQSKQAQLQLMAASAGGRTAAAFVSRDNYVAQLRTELREVFASLGHHEHYVLAPALRAEQQAREALVQAKQEYEVINRHRNGSDLAARKHDERKADAHADDWSLSRPR